MNYKIYEEAIKKLTFNKKINSYPLDSPNGFKAQVKNICEKLLLDYEEESSKLYIYKNNDLIGILYGMKPHYISMSTFRICQNKFLTNRFLKKNNVPVVNSKIFKENEFEEAKKFVEHELNTNFVLKPYDLDGGKGITVNIGPDFFEDAWNYSVEEQKLQKRKDIRNIIEEFHPGIEFRAVVIEGQFHSAAARIPAYVIGDGISTIDELIKKKNEIRKKNPYLKGRLIKLDEYGVKLLKLQDLTPQSIPYRDQIVLLHEKSNAAMGGENIDITEDVPNHIKSIIEKAVESIPGLNYGGVDIIVSSLETFENPKIIEINTNANIMLNHYPIYGEPRAPIETLINSMIKDYELFGPIDQSGLMEAINYQAMMKQREINILRRKNNNLTKENNSLNYQIENLASEIKEVNRKYHSLIKSFPINIIYKLRQRLR